MDGLDKSWTTGVNSNWGKEYHKHKKKALLFTLKRLYSKDSRANSNVVIESDTTMKIKSYMKYTVDGKRVIHKMPLSIFQERLIEHFDIRFKRNTIVWLTRFKTPSVI